MSIFFITKGSRFLTDLKRYDVWQRQEDKGKRHMPSNYCFNCFSSFYPSPYLYCAS